MFFVRDETRLTAGGELGEEKTKMEAMLEKKYQCRVWLEQSVTLIVS